MRRFGCARLLIIAAVIPMAATAGDRVSQARSSKQGVIRELFAQANVAYPPQEIYLRAFKSEGELELWAGQRKKPLSWVKTFPICARSGNLGPKRTIGDGQVPEGFYRIVHFNPASNFHLSLGLDYPNAADRILSQGKPGGDIFIHGNCVTIGCIPIQDDPIELLYLIALDARNAGQTEIPVHVFPHRLDEAGMALLQSRTTDATLLDFWRQLRPAYLQFEATKQPPRVTVDNKTGRYRVAGAPVE